jgi:hypothetical protein
LKGSDIDYTPQGATKGAPLKGTSSILRQNVQASDLDK